MDIAACKIVNMQGMGRYPKWKKAFLLENGKSWIVTATKEHYVVVQEPGLDILHQFLVVQKTFLCPKLYLRHLFCHVYSETGDPLCYSGLIGKLFELASLT